MRAAAVWLSRVKGGVLLPVRCATVLPAMECWGGSYSFTGSEESESFFDIHLRDPNEFREASGT